jgi:hypothetical protein
MSRKIITKHDILDRLKSALEIGTDTELAIIIGVKQNTISGWRKRGSIDHVKIIEICEKYNISLDWVIMGRGYAGQPRAPKSDTPVPDVLTAHRDIVAQFMDAPRAMDANMRLLEIERADPVLFREICAYIKGVVNGIGRRVNGAKDYARNPTPDVPEKKVANGKG